MKFNRILFIVFIFISTFMVTIIICELLTKLNCFDNLVNVTNNTVVNNQLSVRDAVRDVKNVTSILTDNNNSTEPTQFPDIDNASFKTRMIVISVIAGVAALGLGSAGIWLCYIYYCYNPNYPDTEMVVLD